MIHNLIIFHFKLVIFKNSSFFCTNDHSEIFLLYTGLLITYLKFPCGKFGVGITSGRNVIDLFLIILRKEKHKMGLGSK